MTVSADYGMGRLVELGLETGNAERDGKEVDSIASPGQPAEKRDGELKVAVKVTSRD